MTNNDALIRYIYWASNLHLYTRFVPWTTPSEATRIQKHTIMKQFSLFIVSLLVVILAHSQQTNSAVTITILGNKNLTLNLDGKTYNLTNSNTTGESTSILIDNLAAGKHTFQVDRMDLNTNLTAKISGEFNLRPGYDMEINVNQDASLEFI